MKTIGFSWFFEVRGSQVGIRMASWKAWLLILDAWGAAEMVWMDRPPMLAGLAARLRVPGLREPGSEVVKRSSQGAYSLQDSEPQAYNLQDYKATRLQGYRHARQRCKMQDRHARQRCKMQRILHSLVAHKGPADMYVVYMYVCLFVEIDVLVSDLTCGQTLNQSCGSCFHLRIHLQLMRVAVFAVRPNSPLSGLHMGPSSRLNEK